MMMDSLKISPGKVSGRIKVPSSKSLCHRAIICASLAQGESRISNISSSVDIEATIEAMKLLGASIEMRGEELIINGITGSEANSEERKPVFLDCKESGSTLRFLIPIISVLGYNGEYVGQGKLAQRPHQVYYDIFEEQKVAYETKNGGLPLKVSGSLKPGNYRVVGNISSQFISGLLFALPLLEEESIIEVTTPLESKDYVALTLQILKIFGIHVINEGFSKFIIPGGQHYRPCNYYVEGDYSQAAFFMVAAAIAGGHSGVQIEGLNPCSCQGDRVIERILNELGCSMAWEEKEEQIYNLSIYPMEDFHNTEIDVSQCPDLVPILSVLGTCGKGTMSIVNGQRLRYKESDRIAAMCTELTRLGACVQETKDGLIIEGGTPPYGGGNADSWNDHRIAMAIGIFGLLCENGVVLHDPMCVKKSWPDFWKDYTIIGGNINEQ